MFQPSLGQGSQGASSATGRGTTKAYAERDDAQAPAQEADMGTEVLAPTPALLVDAGAGLNHDLDHSLSLAQSAATPYSVPGALDSHRWPGLRDAIAICNAAVRAYDALPNVGAGERYQYLEDLGQLPESGWSEKETLALQKIRAAEAQLCKWGPISARTLMVEKRPRLGLDGQVMWADLGVEAEVVAEWEASRAGRTIAPLNDLTFAAASAMDRMADAARKHREGMALIRTRLGLDVDGGNPTIRGRTWLIQWPVVEAAGEDGTRMRNEAALVVAAPGAILIQGASLLLVTARDLNSEDADLFPTMLSSFTLRLNETQRLAWGPSMHRTGKVYWAVQDEEKKPVKPTEKPRKEKKKKPEPPED